MYLYIQIKHKYIHKNINSKHTLCKHKLLFWMRFIGMNRFDSPNIYHGYGFFFFNLSKRENYLGSFKACRTMISPAMLTINRLLGEQGVMLHLSVCALKHVHPPMCCIEAEGLFMGEATLRKIFWRQETLRGGTTVKESVLQPDRDLFLPSSLPLQRNNTRYAYSNE